MTTNRKRSYVILLFFMLIGVGPAIIAAQDVASRFYAIAAYVIVFGVIFAVVTLMTRSPSKRN